MKIESKQKGFTLIELMIVIAIIGILASIAIPQFATFRIKAFNTAAKADVKNGTTTLEALYVEDYTYPLQAAAAVSTAGGTYTFSNTAATAWKASEKVTLGHIAATTAVYKIAAKHLSGDEQHIAVTNGIFSQATISAGTAMLATDL